VSAQAFKDLGHEALSVGRSGKGGKIMKKTRIKKYAKANSSRKTKINQGWVDPTYTPKSLTKGL
jgi:hypothetical protein